MQWLYRILRPIVRVGLKIYFRKIYIQFEEAIPKKGPIMISANHPSAFLEAILLACFLDRPIHYLVRGDIFKKEFAKKLLALTHQIPIYRFRDGFSGMRRNQETFEKVYQLLSEGKVVVIFSESFTVLEKRLRTIQKGTARMAFGAREKNRESFPIFPIGINYTDATRFRSEVSIIGGAPIYFQDDFEIYQKDKKEAIANLTQKIQLALDKLIIQIKNPNDDQLAESLFEVSRPIEFYNLHPTIQNSTTHFDSDRKTTRYLNKLTDAEKAEIQKQVTNLIEPKPHPLTHLLKIFQWFGYLVNAPVLLAVRYIIKNKVKDVCFEGPVQVATGTIIYGFYISAMSLLFLLIGQSIFIPLLGFPALGYLSLKIQDYLNLYKAKQRIPAIQVIPDMA